MSAKGPIWIVDDSWPSVPGQLRVSQDVEPTASALLQPSLSYTIPLL
jgi:hypothetical protein